jgi:hypothetical protein
MFCFSRSALEREPRADSGRQRWRSSSGHLGLPERGNARRGRRAPFLRTPAVSSNWVGGSSRKICQDLLDGSGERQPDEVSGRIEIVLAGFVDDPKQPGFLGGLIGKDLIELPKLEVVATFVLDADCEMRGEVNAHKIQFSRRMTLKFLRPMPCASYQCTSARKAAQVERLRSRPMGVKEDLVERVDPDTFSAFSTWPRSSPRRTARPARSLDQGYSPPTSAGAPPRNSRAAARNVRACSNISSTRSPLTRVSAS